MKSKEHTAIFGAGCFWCVEAVFQMLRGVVSVQSGYMGGAKVNPTYEEVCTGNTGHAEVIRIVFDPVVISYADLLICFFEAHDPTTLNRQGADKGSQYRSVIFYTDAEQQREASLAIQAAQDSDVWKDPIVTELSSASAFYLAENYHADYYRLNPNASYCSYVIRPKVDKFKQRFSELLK